jgi:hypothetical protein
VVPTPHAFGELRDPESHLIPRARMAIQGHVSDFSIYGEDYETPHGTAVRDYTSQQSIVNAIKASPSSVLNLADGSVIGSILTAADALVDPHSAHPLLSGDSRTIVDVVAGSNQTMLNRVNTAVTPLQGLREAVAVERVSQGATANKFENGHGLDLLRANYTGLGLTHVVASALNDVSVPCYCRGTLIATERGERPVEEIATGDRILTIEGAYRPVKWVGRRSYQGRFVRGRKDILPICFKAGALGDDLPKRDLFVSPLHAMYLEGVLITAGALVNEVNVVRTVDIDMIDYFHIELESHNVIFAEGAASETFIDDDSRGMFNNWSEYRQHYPKEDAVAARYFAPRMEDGFEVEAARRNIAARLGAPPRGPEAGPLNGAFALIDGRRIVGWAEDIIWPEQNVCLDIIREGRLIGRTVASRSGQERLGPVGSAKEYNFIFDIPRNTQSDRGQTVSRWCATDQRYCCLSRRDSGQLDQLCRPALLRGMSNLQPFTLCLA